MRTVVIVQCGGKKREAVSSARDLYTGPLFTACRRAAERIGTSWYIASALHGLIHPGRVVVPYNVTLPAKGDPAWGQRVREVLAMWEPEGWDRLVALCSARYLVGWAAELRAETPLAGLPIGKAIQAANRVRSLEP